VIAHSTSAEPGRERVPQFVQWKVRHASFPRRRPPGLLQGRNVRLDCGPRRRGKDLLRPGRLVALRLECPQRSGGHRHITFSAWCHRIRNMHQAVLKIQLPHRHQFFVGPEAHLRDDADRMSQMAGSAEFDPLLYRRRSCGFSVPRQTIPSFV